jgi:hypothetical protein
MRKFITDKGKVLQKSSEEHVVDTMKNMLDCNSESCIFKKPEFVEFAHLNNLEDLLKDIFKPEGPATNFGLLSNFNIDDVLDQLTVKFKDRKFLHIPFQMRDFEKTGTMAATIDLPNMLKARYKTFGVVFNTDYSSGKGIHWFCVFGERFDDHVSLEYFNSSGKEPLPEIQVWLSKKANELEKELSIPVKLYYSTGISFQNDDVSCGLYAVCYIWLRLENVPPNWFNKDNFNDSMMHKVRMNLFRHDV